MVNEKDTKYMRKGIVADLHNHTVESDGDYTAEQLIGLAEQAGIRAFAITNHDTLNGLKPAVQAAEKSGVEVVCGVELSVRFKRVEFTGTLHLLCYFNSRCLDQEAFMASVGSVIACGRGEDLVRARVAEINRFFGPDAKNAVLDRELTSDDIFKFSDNATRRHFALALEQTFGINDTSMINQIIGNSSPAYLPSGVDIKDAALLMQREEILSVLAHPAAGSFPGVGHYREVLPPLETVEKILPEFLAAGLKGIEVYYPGHTDEHQKYLLELSQIHHLVVTGGSDCHDASQRPFGIQGLKEDEFAKFEAALQ